MFFSGAVDSFVRIALQRRVSSYCVWLPKGVLPLNATSVVVVWFHPVLLLLCAAGAGSPSSPALTLNADLAPMAVERAVQAARFSCRRTL